MKWWLTFLINEQLDLNVESWDIIFRISWLRISLPITEYAANCYKPLLTFQNHNSESPKKYQGKQFPLKLHMKSQNRNTTAVTSKSS